MSTTHLLLTTWSWQPSVVVGCLALLVGYGLVWRRTPGRPWRQAMRFRPLLFTGGVLLLMLALTSPLDLLGDTYLFSAHMVQHLLLIEVVTPLLLMGVTPAMFAWLLAWQPAARGERVLGQPAFAWLLGVGTIWLWHAPALYSAALADERVHILQHGTFLCASAIFWWPVVAPLADRQRLPIWASAGYLALGAFASSVLGILLTFSPPAAYPAYLHPADPLGLLPLLRNDWGMTPVADQRLGGGLMWMAGSLIYLLAMVLSIGRWFGDADGQYEAEARAGEAMVSVG